MWDSLSMSPDAARSVPLIYPQLVNGQSKTEFTPGAERKWELR
jgi:hypothetical protein